MSGSVKEMGEVASGLARNPLGIIALFIVMVYGFATLVLIVPNDMEAGERLPLIWFLVLFPCLVLFTFAWLVAYHAANLFSPSDFLDEENYLRAVTMEVAASLGAAKGSYDLNVDAIDVQEVAETVKEVKKLSSHNKKPGRSNRVLWVDNEPNNVRYERGALSAIGIETDIVSSTDAALDQLAKRQYSVIVSDLARPEGEEAGLELLEKIREQDFDQPFFIYTSRVNPQLRQRLQKAGAQSATSDSEEIFKMVALAVHKAK